MTVAPTEPEPTWPSVPPVTAPCGAGPAGGGDLPVPWGGGRYRPLRSLGAGSHKRVYHAFDVALEREVAVATPKEGAQSGNGLLRLRREARTLARLGGHPGIVTVFDVGEENGLPFLVMEYLSGGSLEQRLGAGGDFSLLEALGVAAELCSALQHVHATGLVHRDVKPANMWLTAGGTVRLGDFGLAMSTSGGLPGEPLGVGTLGYMAPEQADGREVDGRADLYALGAVLEKLLRGQPVPRAVESLVLELLSPRPDDRPADAAVVRRRILGLTRLAATTSFPAAA